MVVGVHGDVVVISMWSAGSAQMSCVDVRSVAWVVAGVHGGVVIISI